MRRAIHRATGQLRAIKIIQLDPFTPEEQNAIKNEINILKKLVDYAFSGQILILLIHRIIQICSKFTNFTKDRIIYTSSVSFTPADPSTAKSLIVLFTMKLLLRKKSVRFYLHWRIVIRIALFTGISGQGTFYMNQREATRPSKSCILEYLKSLPTKRNSTQSSQL